jgi:hypothetical protein
MKKVKGVYFLCILYFNNLMLNYKINRAATKRKIPVYRPEKYKLNELILAQNSF